MALKFHPKAGTILICDFEGLKAPEMVKQRPVVVVSPKKLKRQGLATVVPLSTKAPRRVLTFHHKLDPASLPPPLADNQCWAKCDMLYTVRFERLNLVRGRRDPQTRQRTYHQHRGTEVDLEAIYAAILAGLGR